VLVILLGEVLGFLSNPYKSG